ncbi:MAG: class I SAM-dependent methyltransferase [Halothiobacillaceae bacterium]
MSEFWDSKYDCVDYFYGTEPNAFLTEQAARLPDGARVLVTGDGEGRNGVWLACQGFEVVSVDYSRRGLEKAAALARRHEVSVTHEHADLTEWAWPQGQFDAVVTIFLHFPPSLRAQVHAGMAQALRPGGLLIGELFHPDQLGRSSGGPKAPEMLVTAADMRSDFPGIEWLVLEETEADLDEGPGHQGRGMVTRFVGQKGR